MQTRLLIENYYRAFNAGDSEAMLALMTDDVAHDVNQGERRVGKDAFRAFNEKMARCYAEQLTGIVVMAAENDSRAAAEFMVDGVYIATDEGLPGAAGQRYRLPAGSFFEIRDGRISRVTTYYNLADWLKQVGA